MRFAMPFLALWASLPAAAATTSSIALELNQASGGRILPNLESPAWQNGQAEALQWILEPSLSPGKKQVLQYRAQVSPQAPSLAKDPEQLQDLFSWDLEGFVKSENATDALTATRSYVKKQDFATRACQHVRAYPYLSAWGTLFHPPVKKLDKALSYYDQRLTQPASTTYQSGHPYFDTSFQQRVDKETETELTAGNSLQYLPNNTAIPAKIDLIKNAQKELLVAVMTMDCDASSRPLFDAVLERARAGVDVKVLVEGSYTFLFGRCLKEMRAAGVKVGKVNNMFNPRNPFSVFHVKSWIADGRDLIIGGQNVLEGNNLATGFSFYYRDSDVRVAGPSVTDARKRYGKLWAAYGHTSGHLNIKDHEQFVASVALQEDIERKQGLRGQELYSQWLENPKTRNQGLCRVAYQDAYNRHESLSTLLKLYADQAQSWIRFSTPQLSYLGASIFARQPDEALGNSLRARAQAGVQVDILANSVDGATGELTSRLRGMITRAEASGHQNQADFIRSLERWNGLASAKVTQRQLERLMKDRPNIQVWNHFNYPHAKEWLFDRLAAFVSSYNWDSQSGRRNHEAGILCLDDSLVGQLERQMTLDRLNSIPKN